ncbi:hypothetical protein KKC91_03155 [bacterium]|nr:hypothetical protein [bacterium]
MKKTFNLVLGLFFSVLCFRSALAIGIDPEDILFYAPYDGKAEAEIAIGSPAAEVKGEVDYIEGKKGKAIVLGDAKLIYKAAENLNLDAGTISMWVKPVNWDGKKEMFHFLFYAIAPDETILIIYKHFNPKLGLLFLCGQRTGLKDGKRMHEYANTPEDWVKNEWMHIASTWNKKTEIIELYINGELVKGIKLDAEKFPNVIPEQFSINNTLYGPKDSKEITAYDELCIFKRALSADEIKELYLGSTSVKSQSVDKKSIEASVFSIPFVTNAPVIDGKVSYDEWKAAAKVTGFCKVEIPELLMKKHTTVYACYDNEKLYFLYLSPVKKELLTLAKQRDGPVYNDDAIELFLIPAKELKEKYYQFIGNSIGAHYDAYGGDKSWNGKWEYATDIYEGVWIAECSIAFSELTNKMPLDSSQWLFNFCRDWQLDATEFSSFSFCAQGLFAERFGTMVFTKKKPYLRLDIDYDSLLTKKFNCSTTILNPDKKSIQKAILSITAQTVDGKAFFSEEKKVSLSPGESKKIDIEKSLAGLSAGIIRIKLAGESGQIFFDHFLPVKYPEKLIMTYNFNNKEKLLLVDVDCTGLLDENTGNAIAAIKDKENRTLHSGIMPLDLNTMSGRCQLPISGITPGNYYLEIIVRNKLGESIITHKEPFDYIGTPKWLTEKIGIINEVPKPWTALKVEENIVKCWGREYYFRQSPFPEKITSQKEELLTSPINLHMTVNGNNISFDKAEISFEKKENDIVILAAQQKTKDVEMKALTKIEYDGMMRIEFEIIPLSSAVTINSMVFEVPLGKDTAKLIFAHKHERDHIADAIPEDFACKFYPYVWVGNNNTGLAWFVESDQYWEYNGEDKVIAISSEKSSRYLRIKVINSSFPLKKTVKYVFGLQATPVKPFNRNFRSWRPQMGRNANIGHPWNIDKSIKKYFEADPVYGGICTFIPKSMEAFRNEMNKWEKKGIKMSLYAAPNIISSEATEYKMFKDKWRNPYGPYQFACAKSTFTDFTMWEINNFVKEGNLKSVYVDCCKAYACGGTKHGCGYYDSSGSLRLTYPIFALREYMKRLYIILHHFPKESEDNILWVHQSGAVTAPVISFCDFYFCGEEVEHELAKVPNYIKLYPLDKWRAIYGKQFGVPSALMPNFGRLTSNDHRYNIEKNATFLTLVLLHDTLLWTSWCHEKYVHSIYKMQDDFGIQDNDIEFLPYWNQEIVKADFPEKIKVSIYKKPSGSMIVIGNLSENDKTVNLKIDFDKLGLTGGNISIKDMIENKDIDKENINIFVKKENFKIIIVKKE